MVSPVEEQTLETILMDLVRAVSELKSTVENLGGSVENLRFDIGDIRSRFPFLRKRD